MESRGNPAQLVEGNYPIPGQNLHRVTNQDGLANLMLLHKFLHIFGHDGIIMTRCMEGVSVVTQVLRRGSLVSCALAEFAINDGSGGDNRTYQVIDATFQVASKSSVPDRRKPHMSLTIHRPFVQSFFLFHSLTC